MCAPVAVEVNPENISETVRICVAAEYVTSAVPMAPEPLAGTSFKPDNVVCHVCACTAIGNANKLAATAAHRTAVNIFVFIALSSHEWTNYDRKSKRTRLNRYNVISSRSSFAAVPICNFIEHSAMPRCFTFLRALNVGGHTVKMAQLKSIFESMGFADVQTFIASGNVIFNAKSAPNSTMERKIETRLRAELGYEVATFIRTESELAALATRMVFSEAELATAHSVYIGMLHKPLSKAAEAALATLNDETATFRYSEREIHFLTRTGMSDSRFSIGKFEKQLGATTTFRNINTIIRLAQKYSLE